MPQLVSYTKRIQILTFMILNNYTATIQFKWTTGAREVNEKEVVMQLQGY